MPPYLMNMDSGNSQLKQSSKNLQVKGNPDEREIRNSILSIKKLETEKPNICNKGILLDTISKSSQQ